MKQVRKCKYCGKEFVARSGMQKYCCEECQTKAKEARKKRQQDFMNAVEPVIGLQNQEYLTFAKAAILMGCSRQYVYKLVNEGIGPNPQSPIPNPQSPIPNPQILLFKLYK